jgi:hypothetical protein
MLTRRQSALPDYLRLWWLCASPLALLIASRIVWEKVVLVRSGGPELVGFSLLHLYPTFGIIGILCCYSLMVWLLQAISCVAAHWRSTSVADLAMIAYAILVAAAVVLPERFLA